MLEAFKKMGHYVDAAKYKEAHGIIINDLYPLQKISKDFKGWYVIIPDEEDEK